MSYHFFFLFCCSTLWEIFVGEESYANSLISVNFRNPFVNETGEKRRDRDAQGNRMRHWIRELDGF